MKCPKCQAEVSDDSRFCSRCGASLHPSDEVLISQTRTVLKPMQELPPGTMLAGKYKIVEVVGKGGMGIVYKAEDIRLKRMVALKFLPPELVQDEEAKVRFELEAQAAAALSHPHICTIHEIEEADGKPFIAMEYVEGKSLRAKINKGPVDTDEGLELAIQMAEGLEEAHRKGIVHRDIKSANVMVTDKVQAKIMDFGLAKVKERTLLTREGTTLGTAAYMSPEQARGEQVDARTDIWSLGVVVYEMFSGRLPFKGDREASILYSVVHEEPQPLKAVKRDIPSGIQQIVSRALKKKKEARYQSVTEMLREMKRLRQSLRAAEAGVFNVRSFLRLIRKPLVAVPGLIVIAALATAAVFFFDRQAKIRWARDKAIPEIIKLIEEEKYIPAYQLAQQAENYITHDPLLSDLWPKMSRKVSIQTDPSGADIYRKNYEDINSRWEYLGQSPLEGIRIPIGYFRWKVEEERYQTLEAAGSGSEGSIHFELDKKEDVPPGMVRVPGGKISWRILVNIGTIEPIPLEDFWIDQYEVTNAQYKKFMESGGYQKQEYWKHEFVKEGKVLTWDEAMKEFFDATGRPGPSTWEVGSYPEGEDDYPVTGISWYEAAAYAEFAGKRLPTIYHWMRAAGLEQEGHAIRIIPLSHFGGKGPVQVGKYQGMSPFGIYDIAGNAREWCWNRTQEKHLTLGGSWNDPHYMFHMPYARSSFDRTAGNGFRCMKCMSPESCPDRAAAPLPQADIRDYSKEQPVSDEIFQIYKGLFSYDKTELDPVIESSDEASPFWIKEKITFNAAYGNERVIAYLFLPKNSKPPYQTVVYFPGAEAVNLLSSENLRESYYDFMVKSGRAVLFPIYKSTFERYDGFEVPPSTANAWRTQMIYWYKDLARSIDYLETRSDIDEDKIAFYGGSMGAMVGAVLVALEKRIQASIFYVGGFSLMTLTKEAPEVDQINFAPRIIIPTLMLNGRYDFLFPFETSQLPMYRFLGTPEEHKVHKVYESGHWVPINEEIKETLDWLDRYLGPVKR